MKTKVVSMFFNKKEGHCGKYMALVPRGTDMEDAKSAIHGRAMAKYKADGVPVWFSGRHIGPLTIFYFDVWY